MCLVDNKRFRFTFKRIPVYKVIYVVPYNGILYTPYVYERVTKKMHANTMAKPFEYGPDVYAFDRGFIHAYLNKDSAQHLIDEHFTEDHKIIEGYIPAFTRYAINTCSPYPQLVDSICARRMVFPNV